MYLIYNYISAFDSNICTRICTHRPQRTALTMEAKLSSMITMSDA